MNDLKGGRPTDRRPKRERNQVELDVGLRDVAKASRVLGYVTATNAASERKRLTRELRDGKTPRPEWKLPTPPTREALMQARRKLALLSRLAEDVPGGPIYARKLAELELDVMILEALGRPKELRPLTLRRFGDGSTLEELTPAMRAQRKPRPLRDIAIQLLEDTEPRREEKVVPAEELVEIATRAARDAGLHIRVKVEPRLVSSAAAGDRTMFIAARKFGMRESRRLVVHEVFGHLIAAFNGRSQPLGILSVGTAGAFADQEGLCLTLEERAGLFDEARLRTLAARVLVTDWVHQNVPFGVAARRLRDEYDFSPGRAVILTERGYRGGGLARDVVYLRAWLRIRRAVKDDPDVLAMLRIGKIALDDRPALEKLADEGWVRLAPPYAPPPSLALSRTPTGSGTSLETSPPSLQTSLQRLDET